MTFERPDAWWLLALAAPIITLHFHHRRRRVVEVSSVDLWRGLATGSAGRGRFRLLRDALALAFVLAALGAFTASAAGPVTGAPASGSRRLTIVIDESPSMAAADRGKEAFNQAMKAEAKLAKQDEVVVWIAGGSPRLAAGPEKSGRAVWSTAEAMRPQNERPTLAPRRLAETTRLAVSTAHGGTVLVLTDAVGAESLRDVDEKDADLKIGAVDAGTSAKNAGIVAFDVDPTDESRLIVRVATTDGAATSRYLSLSGGESKTGVQLEFDDSGVATATLPRPPMRASGIVEIELGGRDDFAPDDVARLMLPAAKPLAVAVVSDKPSPFLVEALRAMPDVADPARTTLVAPGGDVGDADVVIAEGTTAPAGKPSLTFVGAGPRVAEKPLLWGVGTHALLAGVDLSPLRIERAVVLDALAGETPIVASAAGTVGVVGETDGVRRVTFGFRPDATTLPLEAAFPLLVRNALRWLAKPPAAPRYVVAGEPWPDGDGALVPYPTPNGALPEVVRSPTGATTVVRWIPPKGFHLSPATPTKTPSAADVVASLPDRHGDSDTRQRHAPWLAAVGAALLAVGAALLRTSRPAVRPSVPAPAVEFAASR